MRVGLLVDLAPEPFQDCLGVGLVGGRLDESQFFAGQWVDAGVHYYQTRLSI